MIRKNSQVTQGQLIFLIVQTQIGIGLLSLPWEVQSVAKGGGWISVLIAGSIVQLATLLIWALCRRFPSSTLFQFSTAITGKWIGHVINLAYIAYFLALGLIVLIHFVLIVRKWVFMETPKWAILTLLIVPGVYLARQNLRIIARFYVYVSFLIVILFLLSVCAYSFVDLTYLFPITEAGWLNIIKGSDKAIEALLGFELLLVFYPFVEGKSVGKLKAVMLANGLVTLFYTYLVFTCLIVFSPVEIPLIPEPVLYMLKSFNFQVVKRIDLLFFSIWVVTMATSFISYLYAASVGLGEWFHQGNHRKAVPYAALICFISAFIPENQSSIDTINQIVTVASYGFVGGLPFIMFLWSFLRRKEGAKR